MSNTTHRNGSLAVIALAALAALTTAACSDADPAEDAPDASPDIVDPQPIPGELSSISAMEFGPDNILFLADATAGAIFAVDTGAVANPNPDAHFNLYGIDELIAEYFEVEVGTLAFPDVVVHPVTHEVFVAVSQGVGTAAVATVVKVSPTGDVAPIDTSDAPRFELADPIVPEVTFWGRVSARTLSITDMDYDSDTGSLYVAGLTNADFASTLYKIAYPFDGTQAAASVGIYHAAHGQTETRAPIRTQTIVDIDGTRYLLAAYTCTPLVAIPLSDIQDGAHLTGKTIAELGSGNTPEDIMHVTYQDMFTMEFKDAIILTNQHRGTMLMNLSDIADAIAQPGLSQPTQGTAGVPYTEIAMDNNIASVTSQGPARVIALRRAHDSRRLDLVSMHKGAWLRLSEYIAEYDFVNWECPPGQEFIAMFSAWLAGEEGIDLESIETGRRCD